MHDLNVILMFSVFILFFIFLICKVITSLVLGYGAVLILAGIFDLVLVFILR